MTKMLHHIKEFKVPNN